MKRLAFAIALAALSTSAVAHGRPIANPFAHPSSAPGGRLEGVVTTVPDGVAIWAPMNHGGVHVTGVSEDGRSKFDVVTDTTAGGFYHVDKLRPGYYDLKISTGYVNGIAYQPQLIYGVEIKANDKTVFNIPMEQGQSLNVVGKPVYPTPAAAIGVEKITVTGPDKSTVDTPTDPSIGKSKDKHDHK